MFLAVTLAAQMKKQSSHSYSLRTLNNYCNATPRDDFVKIGALSEICRLGDTRDRKTQRRFYDFLSDCSKFIYAPNTKQAILKDLYVAFKFIDRLRLERPYCVLATFQCAQIGIGM